MTCLCHTSNSLEIGALHLLCDQIQHMKRLQANVIESYLSSLIHSEQFSPVSMMTKEQQTLS